MDNQSKKSVGKMFMIMKRDYEFKTNVALAHNGLAIRSAITELIKTTKL